VIQGFPAEAAKTLRVGQFNIWEMSTEKITQADSSGAGTNPQLLAAALIIQEVSPDILVINEIDHDYDAVARGEDLALNARRFNALYLRQGPDAVDYPYAFAAPCNTGFLSGKDLDNDDHVAEESERGTREYGGDAYGYGVYPGQYSMAVLSRYPFQADSVRTFQRFRWADLPGNLIPPGWYSPDELEVFRLSSKSHWDLPVLVRGRRLHLLVSHPTPTGYDGAEDRNGRRNFDEIRMWVHYLDDDAVLVDDRGDHVGLAAAESFVLAGDLNADPRMPALAAGTNAIAQLLNHPRVQASGRFLVSEGALMGRAPGAPGYFERHTALQADRTLRIDYLLPGMDLRITGGGVYWPDPEEDPVGAAHVEQASDHRMTWLDLEWE